MRKIIAWFLITSLLNCNIDMVIDTSVQSSDSSTKSTELSEEIETKIIRSTEELSEQDTSNGTEMETEEPDMILTEEISQEITESEEELEVNTATGTEMETEEPDMILTEEISQEITESEEELEVNTATETSNRLEEITEDQDQDTTVPDESEEKEMELEEESVSAGSDEIEESSKFEEESELSVSETLNDDSHLYSTNEYIYNVSFPTNTKAYLDPGNLSGNGQIFSEQYIVENYGNTDVVVRIHNIEIESRSRGNEYEFFRDEITENQSQEKKLNVNMIWKNDGNSEERILNVVEGAADEDVLVLSAAEYDGNGGFVSLRENSIGRFYFTGTLNTNTDIEWKDNDIVVRFNYELIYVQKENCVTEYSEENSNIEIEDEKITEDLTQENSDQECEEVENQVDTIEKETETEMITESEMTFA